MIPRPFERPEPEKKVVAPIDTITVDVTVLEIQFPNDKMQVILFNDDKYEILGDAILVEYAENPSRGRSYEKVMIFRSQVYYMSERKTQIEIPAPKFVPSVTQAA